jgi:CBS domain-containing protein
MKTVRDVMTTSVLTVPPDAPLKEVALLLLDNRVSGAPVVDAAGHVLGMVSEGDFLVKEQGSANVRHRPLARLLGESPETGAQLAKVGASTAGEAMTAPAVTIAPDRPINEAAAIMTARGHNRLPVIDDGHLVGIVTRADLVRAYVVSDEELARTVREEILLRILWLDPADFSVRVTDGVVAVAGRVDRRSTAETIARVIAMAPGVVAVRSEVSWARDDRDVHEPAFEPFVPMSAPARKR